MLTLPPSAPVLCWDGRFGRRRRNQAPPRPFAALGYLVDSPVVKGLVEIENLVLVVLYDEPQESGKLALRLAGFSGRRVPWGVQWGGIEGSLFFKDFLLRPRPQARGLRVEVRRESLLRLALTLDRQIERHTRYPWIARGRRLSLPGLWAGFRSAQAAQLTGDGPEWAARVQKSRQAPRDLLAERKRTYEGLTLYPLAWVSHHWQQIAAVFADLQAFPRWQVFPLTHLPEDLQGFQGASQFDFFQNRFRRFLPPRVRPAAPDPHETSAGSATICAVSH